MKLKDLRAKDVEELRKLLRDAKEALPKLLMDRAMHKSKNVKALTNKRREVAILSGMVRAKELGVNS